MEDAYRNYPDSRIGARDFFGQLEEIEAAHGGRLERLRARLEEVEQRARADLDLQGTTLEEAWKSLHEKAEGDAEE